MSGEILAGVAKVDITDRDAGPVNDPLYVKALALRSGSTEVVIITVDAVAVEEIGPIKNGYLAAARSQLGCDLGIAPKNVVVNASHCHGAVCGDVVRRTVEAVTEAWGAMTQVQVGVGTGHEDRIMENRRFRLRDGREADARRAYSLPADSEVVGVGPIDPEIGILRLDRADGQPLAVLYTVACHPIKGMPGGGTTADLVGVASQAIEDSLGEGTVALFVQGCAGDINPALYKDVNSPPDADRLGSMLGVSVLKGLRGVEPRGGGELVVINELLDLPREDLAPHIAALEARQMQLLQTLRGTDINLKTFIPLLIKHGLSGDSPSYYSYRYLHEDAIGQSNLVNLDNQTREGVARYVGNIHTMEELTRVQANLGLLRMHHAQNVAAGTDTITTEVVGIRIGDFVLVMFPGELSVQIGLNIKQASRHPFTFIAGVSNGYIYYAPTAEQLTNRGGAQEDSDCYLASGWQALFEGKAADVLQRL